jgi:hypothetical protein
MGKLFASLFQAIYLAFVGTSKKIEESQNATVSAVRDSVSGAVSAVQKATDATTEQLAVQTKDFTNQIGQVGGQVDALRTATGESQKAIVTAVDERLNTFANSVRESNDLLIKKLDEIFSLQEGYEAAEKYRIEG